MRQNIVLAIATILLFASSVAAEVTGNDWRLYDEHSQRAYLAGVIDTWGRIWVIARDTPDLNAEISDRNSYYRHMIQDMYGRLALCAREKNMAYEQFPAIASRYLNAHPEEWGDAMPSLFWFAMRDVCGKFPHPQAPSERDIP